MKIKLRRIKRLVSQLLRFIFRPKILSLVTLTLFLADYILFKILGDNFEEKSTFLNTVFLVGEIYITLGFTTLIISKLKNVKWYKSVSLLFSLSIVALFIYLRFTEPYDDLRTIVSILSFVVLAAFLAALVLSIKHIAGFFTRKSKDEFTIRQIKHSSNYISFRQKLNRQNVALAVRFLIFAVLLIGVVYAVNRINTLENKLTKIEAKRGGPEKIVRTKNNCHDLAIMAKKVGSNFFLMNRRLSANLNYAFAALSAEGGAASAAPNPLSISKIVSPGGLEPPTYSLKGSHSAIELWALKNFPNFSG